MKLLVILWACILLYKGLFAQWEQVPQIPETETSDIYVNNELVVITGESGIYVSTNSGSSFTYKEVSPIIPVVLKFLEFNDKWVVGTHFEGVFISDNNGETWQPFSTGLPTYFFSEINRTVYYRINDLTIWQNSLVAATDGAGVYKLSESTWASFNSGLGSNIHYTVNSIFSDADTLISSAGINASFVYRSPSDPEWKINEFAPFDPNGLFIHQGLRISPNHLILTATNGIYLSSHAAGEWEYTGVSSFFFSAGSILQNTDSVIAILSRPSTSYFLSSHDQGKTWKQFNVSPGKSFHKVKIVGNYFLGTTVYGAFRHPLSISTGINDVQKPSDFLVNGIFPNPFNPTTHLSLEIQYPTDIKIEMLNLLGQQIQLMYSGNISEGKHTIPIHAGHLSSGVYIIQIVTENKNYIGKIMLLK